MANEFKIKKGLIVTGASGGTVADIQGSQGQLFSVTDDLSGSIFAVSDISGVPILDVNSSGTSYFVGKVGIGINVPTANLHVQGSSATDAPIVRVGGFGNSGSILELAETLVGENMTFGFSFEQTGNTTNKLLIKRHDNSASGTAVITLSRTDNNVSMSGGLSLALKATSSSTLSTDGGTTLTTKNYVDALTPGVGVFLPLSAGTSFPLTGALKISENSLIMSGRQTGVVSSSLPKIVQAVLESSIETNNAVVHPYFNNDLANFVARGGNVTVGGVTTQPSSGAKNVMFQPSNQFMGISSALISGSTWTITILSDGSGDAAFNLTYGCHIGITFGSSSFDPTSMLIEATTDATGATGWTTALNSSAAATTYVTFASSSGTGIKALRFTMGYTSGDPRVNSIFAYNYASAGMKNFFLAKDGGKVYGDIETTTFGSSVAINKITNSGNSYFNGGKVGITVTTPVETLTVPSTKGVMFGYKRFYSNSATVPAGIGPTYFFSATLNEQQGTTLTSQYQYKFYLTTTGTGTYNSSVYIVYRNSADTAWDSHRVSSTGLSSNHPELVISGNSANIYNDHPSAYGTAYRVETSYSQQAKTSPQIFGSDYMWTRDNTDLYYMDGDVGIGVSNPAFKLDVAGAIQTTGSLRITTANPGIIFKETDIVDKNWDIQVNNGNLKFYEVNDARSVFNEHVTFGTGGNVGIGFTSPQAAPLADMKLSVNGRAYVATKLGIGATAPTYNLQLGIAGTLSDSIRIGSYAVAKNTRQYIGYARADTGLFETSTSGNTPSSVLPGVSGIRIVNTEGSVLSTKADQSIQLLTHIYNGSSRVALHANYDGNIGIGVTSPLSKLTIDAPVGNFANGTNAISLNYDGGSSPGDVGGGIVFSQEWWSGSAGQQVTGGIYGIKNAGDGTYGGGLAFYTQPSSAAAMAQRMIIDTDGNVGIGTASPSQKLHVSGNARVTGAYYDSNNSAGTSGQILSSTATGTDWVSAGGTSGFAPMVKFNRSGINSSTYTMIATVNGDNLSSVLKMTMTGTSGNVVFACDFDIIVNHSQDVHVKSSNGDYTEVTLRITSNNNEDFSIEAKHNGSTTTTAEVCIFPLADEIITPTTTDPGYTGIEYEHTATEGWRYGGVDNSVESSNVIVDGKVGIGTTSPGAKLEIEGDATSNDTAQLIVASGGADNNAIIHFSDDNGGQVNAIGALEGNILTFASQNELVFKTGTSSILGNTNTKMTISTGGAVGIGVTTPNSNTLLDVAGKVLIKTSNGVSDLYLGNYSTAKYVRFHTNNTDTYFDMNCGNVLWRQGSGVRFEHDMTAGTFTASGDVIAYGSPSDKRLKENIKPIESALDKAMKLQGVTFDWKESDSLLDIKEDIGFIAQDVQKVVPELVRENDNGMLSMRHQGIAPILLEAIKELKAEIEELKKQIK